MDIQERVEEITDVFPVSIEALVRLFDIELDKKAILPEGISGQIEKLDNGKYKISCNKSDGNYPFRIIKFCGIVRGWAFLKGYYLTFHFQHFCCLFQKNGSRIRLFLEYLSSLTRSQKMYLKT